MSTSTLLRQCLHELEAAHAEAVMEYGAGSRQADDIGDALWWLRDWMTRYLERQQLSENSRR